MLSSGLGGWSPPARGRGLKLVDPRAALRDHPVAPRAGAWIETSKTRWRTWARSSSPPARGRGLKRLHGYEDNRHRRVAPRAGAWIETCISSGWESPAHCRPPRGGVD